MAFEFEHEMKPGAAPTPDEVTIETRSVKVFSAEEDEYEWIVRSTPAIATHIFIEDWREPELMRPPSANLTQLGECNQSVSRPVEIADGSPPVDSERSAPDVQLVSPAVAADASEAMADSASATVGDESVFADWTGPDLVPATPASFESVSRRVGIACDSPPVASERSETSNQSVSPAVADGSPAVDGAFIDWSAPDLVAPPQVNFEDVELGADADLVQSSSSVTIDESAFAEWTGPELLPPPPVGAGNNLNDIEANKLEEPPASELSLAGESASSEWTGPELMPAAPVESKEIEADEYEEITEPGSSRLDDEAEVDRCIAPDTVAAVQTRTLVVQCRPSVVHALKDPPEIWDQVPEQPADFHPAVTFLARVTADNRKLLLVTLAVMVFCGLSTFAVLKLRQLDRDIEFVTKAQSEHRKEVQPPTVVDSVNKEVTKPAIMEGTKETVPPPSIATATGSNDRIEATSSTVSNTAKSNATATARNVTSVPNKPKSAPDSRTVAKTASTARKGTTPRIAATITRRASTTSRSAQTSRSTPNTPRRSEPERTPDPTPIITVGDGETRPRRVTQRTPATKEGASISSPQSQNAKN
ncbi:MAG TPA: hypothetical protein VN643_01505 [Pyrinomonadaceae bacterium]|nr:hypothetical protein [Pyrinomonadaceae bacterium]